MSFGRIAIAGALGAGVTIVALVSLQSGSSESKFCPMGLPITSRELPPLHQATNSCDLLGPDNKVVLHWDSKNDRWVEKY